MPAEYLELLKGGGLLGVIAILLFALKTVTGWWRDSMEARLADQKAMNERMAVAIERQAQSNADVSENMKEVREGQGEILKVSTEAALTSAGAMREVSQRLTDIKQGVDQCRSGKGGSQ